MQRIIASWNVLADGYVRASYYPRIDPALLVPGARRAALAAQIAERVSLGELVCLQEIEPSLVGALRARGVAVEFAPKLGDRPDGIAIAGAGVTDAKTLAFADATEQVALIARIDDAITVATTHLRWDRPAVAHEQRFAVSQLRELFAELATWPRPWIACGDFNFTPDDPAYALLVEAGFVDACRGATANPHGRAKRIDYLWHTRELVAEALPTLPVADDTPLPSRDVPSDHVPVAARFSVNSPDA
ncbi:MAG TPA: endonuclease/exonuclease/phosphatase family protein [Kofleriaceae bacterium]